MNKIFKVIWSKSKQCYIVVSEIAKNKTGKKKIVVAGIFAALAMVNGGQATFAAWPAGGEGAQSAFWMGRSSSATGQNAQAIGVAANASSAKSVAIGSDSFAQGVPSGGEANAATAVGAHSNATGPGASAFGFKAIANAGNATAIGTDANVSGQYSVGVGWKSKVTVDNSIAIGEQAKALKEGSSVMGPDARGYGNGSLSLGYQALAGANTYTGAVNNGAPFDDKAATINAYNKWGDAAIGLRAVATGGNATALGRSASATAANAIAIGGGNGDSAIDNTEKTEATGEKSTAIGYNAKAKNTNDIAIGMTANASDGNAIAIGRNVTSAGGASTSIGYYSSVTGNQSIGIGSQISNSAQKATAIGYKVTASGSGAIGIGSGTDGGSNVIASGSDAIALGTSTLADSEKAIAIGANSKGTAIGATALGRSSAATGASATALGSLASATGTTATAVGMQASASGNESLAIGTTASATSGRALAVGTNAKATGENSVAVGSGAGNSGPRGFASSINSSRSVVNTLKTINYATTAEGDNAVALGFYANAKNSGVAVGQNALAATGGVAIGKGVFEDTNNNLAGGVVIGQDSASTGIYSLAMGRNAFATGSTSMAMGYEASANGNFAVAMGRNVTATGTSTAIGHHATASNGGLAIGSQENDASNDKTTASAKGAVAIGKNTTASSEDTVAIGTNAQSDKKGAVALGSGSTTATSATNIPSATINGITYNFAGATNNPNMQVSVGNASATRQIKNVAAGEVSATSTDAINGSQLYAVASAIKPIKYVSINSTATGAGSNVDNDGAQGGNSIAIGPSSTVTRQNGIAIGSGAQSLSEDSVVIGRNAKAETKAGAGLTTTSRAIVIGSNSRVAADVTQGVAIGSGLSPDEGAVVTGDQSIAIGGNVKVDGHSAIAIGGDDARKAANQLVSYTNKNDAEVTGTLQTAISDLTGYNLNDYKGTTASHAGVAYGASALAGNAGVAIGTAADSMTRKNDKGQVVNNKPVTNAVAIGTGARANFDNSVAIGGGSNTDHYATKQVNAIIDGVEVKWSGGENISPGDVVSFGAKGFERQLKNVAPGEVSQTSTDAVNGSQIYSLARKVTNIMNGGSGSVVNVNATGEPLSKVVTGTGASKVERYYRTVDVEDDGTLKNGAIAQTPTSLALVNIDQTDTNKQTQTPRILGNVANGVKDNDAVNVSQLNAAKVKYFSVNSTDAGNINNDGATGTDAIAIGPSAVSNAVGSVALGKDAKANGDFTVALGGGNWQFKGAQANGVGTTALGSSTKTKVGTNYQTAIGFGATTEAESALAVGYNAAASAQNAIALGRSASTAGQDAVALGSSSQAKGDSGLAIGNGAQANSNSVISLGYQANNGASNNTNGVAIGWAAGMQSNGLNNVGVGTNAGRQVIGNNNTSLGNGAGNIANTKIYTSESIMLGTGAKVVGSSAIKSIDNVIAIGKNTSGSASSAIAVGINAGSSAENGVAIGPNSNTSAYNGIALGSFSEASTAAGVPGYNVNANRTDKYAGLTDIALTSKLGAVSVGNSTMTRQITGVAAGTNDTDAVNIAQLKSVNLAFTGNTGSGDVNLANSKLSINGDNTYIKTAANGKQLTISPNVQNITLNNGRASASTGLADASNVAQAINNVVSGVQLDIVANKGTKTGSVNLSNQKLTVTGGNGIRTDIYANTGGQNLVIGLEPELVNATTKGIGLTGDTGSTGLKYLKDGDATFKVAGDGNLVTTVGSAAGVKVSVDSTKVKDLAVEAVTVSKANTVDNPITVTPKAGTNSKEYAIGIDTTKLAAKTHLAYTANGGTAKTVSLAKGLNFVNGTNTVATVDSDGKVSFDINKDTKDSINKSATAVGRTITLNADSGTGSSQSLSNGNVSFAVSGATGDYISTTMDGSAVKVSTKRATINSDANTGAASVTGADGLATAKNVASAINSAVNGLSQNLNISDGTKDSSVALKNQKLTVTGTGAVKATVNGQTITIDVAKGTLTANADGTATGTAGVADASDVASAINNTNTVLGNKITKNTQDIATNTSNITANKNQITTNTINIATNTTNIAHTIALADDNGTSTTAKSLKDGNVSFNIKGDNKFISTAASGNDVTLTVNEQAIKDAAKNASSFKVKANATAAEDVKGGDTIAFNNGDNIEISQTGKTFTIKTAKNITVDSVTAGNTVINTSGLTNGTTAITGTGVTTDKVTVGGLSIDKTAGINAGGKVISNVASGGTTDSNAANIGDVKQAVANLSQNLNITDGTNNGTVDLKNQKLNVAGANGVTATVNNQTITVGLDANTVNATTKGIGLTGDTGSTGNKYLKDGDVSFAVTGDGNLVSTSATAAGVKVAVDAAKVKDLAVAAVTVSKDTQADNPITVTPTAGTNSKDYAIGIDTTKLAAKTDLTYRANSAADANAKKVSLSKGLNFVDGDSTVATVDNDGKVSFDLNTATKNQINTNTTDIATNKGKIATNTTNIAANTTALARHISLGADTGTSSSQSLSAADVAFNVKGATGDFVSTNMNGNTVEISTKRATINSNATTGEASVTGNDGLATAQNVADAINKAADAAKAGAAWNITTNSSTTDKTAVKGGDTVDLVNGDNIEITQDGTDKKKITVATKKDITVDSVTANNKVTVGSGANKITLDGTDGSVTGKAFTGTTFTGTSFTGTSFTAGNTVINTNGLTNGTTAITGTGVTTDNVTVGGISIDKTDGINAGNKVISNVASGGTTLTNAANIGDVQNAVANLSQNLNITDGTHDGTVDLKNQKLNVAGANGVTATVNNQTITVGLDADTVNATTKGIGLTADTGSTGNKYLKDGDVSFAVTGDGSLVSTSATAAGVKVAVNSATITAGTDGTITGPTTDGVATAKNVADAINAAKKASKTEVTANTGEAANATTGNVTLTSTTAADGHTIYDVKLNDKVTLGTGVNAVTIDGTTGAITGKTATIGGVTVNGTANTIGGLSNTTWNGTAVSGRAATEDQLKAATGATTLKFTGDVATNTGSVNLKDDTFGIKGDGKYISTDVNGKNVNLTVSEAEVKKSAVAAVTVSTDTTDANNPLTVTPTTSADGTTKDYKVTIDGTKIANKTNLSYKANNGTAKQVSLADGLDFTNGTLTTASIDNNGVVKYDVNTAAITAGADGTITGPTKDGVATAQNVADAINAAKKASKTEITANTGEAANATTGNVTLTSTTAADGHTIYDVKLNDKVTLGTGANAVTIDGTAGKAIIGTAVVNGVANTITTGGANAVTLDGATAKVTAGVTTVDGTTGTITTGGTNSIKVDGATGTVTGLTNKDWTPGITKAVTGRAATEDQLQKVADAASSQTWNITADKAGTTGNQTGTKKNATVGKDETVELVAGDNLTINQNERKFTYSLNKDLANLTSVSVGTGTTETIKLDGATGKITAKNASIGGVTIDGDNNHVTGLSNITWNGTATTGRAATEDQLKAVADTAKTTTDAVNLKFSGDTNTSPGVVNLKDDTLGIIGDGKYVSTDANGKNLTVKVSEAEVKKSAVAAVTVSTDTTDANNPLTVTPTTSADGTTKDYKVTIDGAKIANKTNLSYKANNGTAKQVSLADGLNFKNGTLTTASIDDKGVVKYDVNTASITAGTDGTITGPTTDGVATAKNVADAINAAKKASKTEITANTGEAANATTGNVSLTSTTAADGHTIYDVKLNDKVTLGTSANAVTIDGTTGAITGKTANIGGVTVNGTANTIGGLSNTTWNGTATTGRAATEDQLKAVADAAGSQTWEITADKKAGTSGAQTGTKENAKVGKDDKVSLIAGENLTVDQSGKNFTYSLNTDLVKMNSATFLGTGTNTTVITGDSITQTAGTQTNTSTAGGNTVADGTKSTKTTADGQVIKDGTKSNKSTVDNNVIDDGNGNVNTSNATSNTITDGTNTSTITAGKAQIGTVGIDGVASKITTGGTNAVVVNGADGTVKTGNVTVTGGTTNDITGLSNTTLSATDFATKGRAATEEQLKAATGATTLKFTGDVATNTGSVNLKDDTFGIKGDGKYISTDVNGKNVNLTVSEAEVKKSAVAAVTVSTDTTDANNPLTVTPTTSADGTTKDYKVTIDGTKIANKTNLSYKANNGTAKQVSLADGLDFTNGTLTTASIDDKGVVKYDVNTASITAGTDGTITGPTTDGVATAKNVADAINAAKKASKTEITANTGEAANATTGNVSLTSTTAADGHTIYDVKLNDKVTLGTGANVVTIDGTAGKATIGSSIVDGVNNTFTTGGASPVTLNGATGTITGKTANIGGVTVDGTNNHVMGLANKDWTPGVTQAVSGRAATEDQLQKVSDAVGAGWKVNTGKVTGSTGESNGATSTKVSSGEEVQFQAGNNLIVDQNGKTVAYSLNKALKDLESATFNGTGTNNTVITGDSITQTAGTQTNTATAGGNIVADGTKSTKTTADGQVIKDGTKTNTSTVDENTIVDGTKSNKSTVDGNTITDGTNTTETTSSSVTVKDNAGNSTVITKDNITTGVGANKVTLDGTAGKATVGASVVDGVNNTFTTGGANAVKLDGAAGTIKTGTVTVTGGTTNDITGLSNTTVTAADFATKGRAATEEQLKAVGEQTWQITADKDTATSGAQTGTKKDAKVGKDDKVQLIAGENMTVNQNERDFTFTLNKDLVKMNSATFLGTGTNTTVITGDSITQTAGTQTNTSTAAGNTVANGANSTATTAAGTTVTTANGNTNYAADGVRINTTGKTPVSLTDAGLDNGNNVIKNVASGHVNNDATDNTNAANIADVKKATTTVTANAGEVANATTGNVTLTSTAAADGHTIYDVKLNDKMTLGSGANAVTIDSTAGKATIGSSIVDGVNNTFTTGGASSVTLNGATGTITGKTANIGGVTVDGTNNHVMGLANKDWTPGVTQAVSGRAATEDQLQKVSDAVGAGWKVNTGKVTGSTGESNGATSTKVASGEEVQFQAGNNLIVDQNGKTVAYSLNKALKDLESATFNGTGTNKTVITGDSITQTAGTQTNTSTAGGNTVADGTKSTETTAAGQVIKDGTKSNKSTVDNNVIDDGNGNVNTSNATSNTITDGTNTTETTSSSVTVKDNAGNSTVITKDNITTGVGGNRITLDGTAGKATIGSSIVDGVNNTFTTGGANAVKLDGAAGTIKTGNVTVTGGTTNDITGLSNTTVTATDFATKGRAATEEQLKAVGEQTWQITADKDTTTSGAQTGTKKDAKVGKDDKVQLIAGENMTVNQNERDFTFTLNKNLVKMNSATFLGTGTNTTVITGDSITQTAGTQTNTSTAAGNTVADGTKSTETTAAGQVIKDGAKSNKSTVDNNVIDDGNGNVNTSNATSNTITDGTNTSTITAGKATIGTSVVDGVNNTFTTGGANAVKVDGAAGTIKTGNVTVTGGTTNDITGLSNTTVTATDFATKGRAATEEQLKAVGEQTWQITADKDTTTSGAQTGTKKDAKVGKDDKVQLIAGENMTVNQNERDFTFTLNKDLVKMNSATFLGTGTNTTVITGDSITQTAGTQTNTSTAGGNTVADGTKSTKTTADGQVIKDGTKSNKSTVDNNVIDDGNGNVNTSNATSNTITDGTNTTATTSSSVTVKDNAGNSTVITKDNITMGVGGNKITLDGTAGKATIGSSIIDGVNKTFTTGGTNAVTLDGAASTVKTGTVTVTGGTTNDITGLSNTTVNSADFATKGRAATEEQLKAVGEQTWQITTDKKTGTSGAQTGLKENAKVGKDDKVSLIAGENLTVDQAGKNFTYSLNSDLVKMNSATFLGTGTNTTVITGDSITQTAGTQTNTSTAVGNTVADGTKSTETTAAGQVIKDGTKTNTSTVDENTIVDGTKSNKSTVDGNTITDGTNTTATTSSSVTVKDNAGNSTVITKDNITTGVGGNKITLDGTAGKATIGSSVVDGVNNTFTTGGTNAVTMNGAAGTIKTGTVTVTGGTTNDITGLSNTTVNSTDFATKGRAATEEQLKAVGEQTWQITADKDTTTSGARTGTKKDAKVGKDDKVQLIAGENMTINQNERDFTFTLNKDLVKMNSATFLGTGSNTTVITGNSITQTAGTQTNTSTAGGNTVADGTKSTETTAAGQVIKDGAKSNKSTVDSNVIDDGNGNVNTSNATSNTITDGTNTSTVTAGKANIGNIAVDGVNNKITMGNGATPVTLDGANGHLDGLTNTTWVPGVTKATTGRAATEDQLQQVSDAVGAGWKVNTGTVAGSSGVSNGAASTKVSSGEEVKLQAGDNLVIDQNGKTVSYSLNKDLTKMNSATFEAIGGKTTVIKGDSIVQTDGGKTNTSNAAGNTVADGTKSTATTAAGTTITDGAKTNTSTADKNVIDDGAGNKSTFTKDGITITKTGKDTVSLTSNGLDNGNNKIVNVADGTNDTDAVNVRQLDAKTKAATTELTANGGESADNTTGNIVLTKTTAPDGHIVYDNKLNDKITLGAADPRKAITVDGTNGTIKAGKDGNAVAINGTDGTIKAGDGTNAVAIDGVNGSVKVADKIALNGKDGKAAIGTVGIDGKDGIITTGGNNPVAVNGKDGVVTGLTNKTWDPNNITSGRAATEDQVQSAVANAGWDATVGTEGSGVNSTPSAAPEKIRPNETLTFKAGNNMMVSHAGKTISYAVNPELTDMKSATFKDAAGNTTVTNGNGITITPGSANPNNPNAGPVSLTKDGLNNGNNQIKGVAPGSDDTDAVNIGQLKASNAKMGDAIGQVAGEVQRVGAHAAAMAALKPIQYDPLEPTQVMAGVGNYRGETAAALGLAHYTNENTMFNVGVSVGGNHNMVNAGVTHKFGYSPEKKNIPDRYKAGPISSVYVMQDEVSSLKKENAEQKYVIADQAARLNTLEAENERQRQELAETKQGLDDLRAAVDKLLASKG